MFTTFQGERGVQESMETPPNVPPLTERKDKRKKPASGSTSAGESFVQIVEVVTFHQLALIAVNHKLRRAQPT